MQVKKLIDLIFKYYMYMIFQDTALFGIWHLSLLERKPLAIGSIKRREMDNKTAKPDHCKPLIKREHSVAHIGFKLSRFLDFQGHSFRSE